jgi:hypothetical protein
MLLPSYNILANRLTTVDGFSTTIQAKRALMTVAGLSGNEIAEAGISGEPSQAHSRYPMDEIRWIAGVKGEHERMRRT